MTSSSDRDHMDATDYVQRLSSDIRNGARELVAENEGLRGMLADDVSEIEQLRAGLDVARAELSTLRGQCAAAEERARHLDEECRSLRAAAQLAEQECACLRRRLATTDQENHRISDGLVGLTEQNANIANLYVAAYRLHSALERSSVVEILKEILANLIGSEEMALFAAADGGETLHLTDWAGIDPEPWRRVARGAGIVGNVAATGRPYFRRDDVAGQSASAPSVCIPLKLQDRVSGALAVFRLLPQKVGLAPIDIEVFELLATHAATALYCAELHARFADRLAAEA